MSKNPEDPTIPTSFERLKERSNLCAGALSECFAEDDELVRELVNAGEEQLRTAIRNRVYGRVTTELSSVISPPMPTTELSMAGYVAKLHSLIDVESGKELVDRMFAAQIKLLEEDAAAAAADLKKCREAERFAEIDVNTATQEYRTWKAASGDTKWLWRKGLTYTGATIVLVAVDLGGLYSSMAEAMGVHDYPRGLCPPSLIFEAGAYTCVTFTSMLVGIEGLKRAAKGLSWSPRARFVATVGVSAGTAVLMLAVATLRSGAADGNFASPLAIIALVAVAAMAVIIHYCGNRAIESWRAYHALSGRSEQFTNERRDRLRIQKDRSTKVRELEDAIKAPGRFRAKVEGDLAIVGAKLVELDWEAQIRSDRATAKHRDLNQLDGPDRLDAITRTTVLSFRKEE